MSRVMKSDIQIGEKPTPALISFSRLWTQVRIRFSLNGRDDDTVTHASILQGVLAARANDDIQHHQMTDLPSIYLHDQIRYYDVITAGFDESADLLAAQIPSQTGVSKYLDLGTGTAKTAIACIQTLASNS